MVTIPTNNNGSGVFVTGTDTEVGKTVVSTGIITKLAASGCRVAGYKPVAAGCDEHGQNEDAQALLAASNVALEYANVNPYALPAAKAPHIAAEEIGEDIRLSVCVRHAQKLMATCDVVVAEGAGGWYVPLNEAASMADIAKQLQWPVVVVVGLRLGCLNHALLTVRAIQQDGLPVLGWVANHLQRDWPDAARNIATLRAEIDAPLIGVVPFQNNLSRQKTAECLHLERAKL